MQIPTLIHAAACACLFAIAGCSPKFDWREVRGNGYVAMLPAKPATLARPIRLGNTTATMTMHAAEIDGVTYAIGSAELADAASAGLALQTMKTGLVKNINGTIRQEKFSATPPQIEIEAVGTTPGKPGPALLLSGRLVAHGKRIYQVIVVGPEKAVVREAVDTFLAAFKPVQPEN